MRIAEIFYSVQGEGMLTGVPSVFIRTGVCNLRCTWCDTPYASWNPDGRERALEDVITEAVGYGAGHVVVTGGVTVGERCVIGANSVVTSDVPPFSIAAGAPARVVRRIEY